MDINEWIQKEETMSELIRAYRKHYINSAEKFKLLYDTVSKLHVNDIRYAQIECKRMLRFYSFGYKTATAVSVVLAILSFARNEIAVGYYSVSLENKSKKIVIIFLLVVVFYWICEILSEKYKYILDVIEQYNESKK